MVLGRLSQGIVILVICRVIHRHTDIQGRFGSIAGHQRCGNGFAFRDILQNFLAGILILLAEPFRLDDQIVFKEFEGTVENIQTRRQSEPMMVAALSFRILSCSLIRLPLAFENRRLGTMSALATATTSAKQLMLEAIHSVNGVLKDPAPDVLVVELAESSVNIRARWWINPPRRADALDARDKVISAIKQKLYVEHGIDLPYPTRQILFHDQTEETDGDRSSVRDGQPEIRKCHSRAASVVR